MPGFENNKFLLKTFSKLLEQLELNLPRNPKRNGQCSSNHINWFPYYAGYNSQFVNDVLTSLKLKTSDTILDPWNGSGTTTTAAYRMGANVVGCDINPVMVVVAKSALLEPGAAQSLVPLCAEILHAAESVSVGADSESLTNWFSPSSAGEIRKLHCAIWKVLVDSEVNPVINARSLANVSTLAAFFLTALMRTTRHFLTPFIGSNPTWIRNPASPANRLRTSRRLICEKFREEVRLMALVLGKAFDCGLRYPAPTSTPQLLLESSLSLPIKSRSVNAIVSSPPYLTRIDYAVATKPELAVLGMSLAGDFEKLRKSMTGAPTIRPNFQHNETFGRSCSRFLKAVENHSSKGSRNYYLKMFVQYFSDMACSLREIARVMKNKGKCILVVQDSYYKELRADLANYTTEIAEAGGLKLFDQHDFEWNRNMSRINSRSSKYREAASAVESVLWFSKG